MDTRKMTMRICIVVALLFLSGCFYPPYWSSGPTQRIDFYNPDSSRAGWGTIQGGRVDFYNPNGSRSGYGRTGR